MQPPPRAAQLGGVWAPAPCTVCTHLFQASRTLKKQHGATHRGSGLLWTGQMESVGLSCLGRREGNQSTRDLVHGRDRGPGRKQAPPGLAVLAPRPTSFHLRSPRPPQPSAPPREPALPRTVVSLHAPRLCPKQAS